MDNCKYQVKIRKDDGKVSWTHLTYLPLEFKEQFDKVTDYKGRENNDWVDKWAREDFNMDMVDSTSDLDRLKENIQNKYRELYPELHILSSDKKKVDLYGWNRLWVISHMKKEMERQNGNI